MIRKSSRKEFENAKDEGDSLIIMKMIMTTREAIEKSKNSVKFTKK